MHSRPGYQGVLSIRHSARFTSKPGICVKFILRDAMPKIKCRSGIGLKKGLYRGGIEEQVIKTRKSA